MAVNRDVLGVGVMYPFQFNVSTGGVAKDEGLTLIKGSLLQIIGTAVGSRVFLRTFGSRLRSLMFEPNDPSLLTLIEHNVREAVRNWEPRIEVLSVGIDSADPLAGRVDIRVAFKVIQVNVVGNLVYPLYLSPEAQSRLGEVTG